MGGLEMAKLLLVEGIPGSGKTTTAKKLCQELESQGKKVNLFLEGDLHPADMSWQAYLTQEEYKTFRSDCKNIWMGSSREISLEELYRLIEEQTQPEGDHLLVAYTHIRFPESTYWQLAGELEQKEICNRHESLEQFKNLHLQRWQRFAENVRDRQETYIFECAFLQNHLFEMVCCYEREDTEVLDYLKQLIRTVQELQPELVYILPEDTIRVIEHAALERKAPHEHTKDWIELIAEFVENSAYGKTHLLHGKDGVIKYCEELIRLGKLSMKELGIPVTVIDRK